MEPSDRPPGRAPDYETLGGRMRHVHIPKGRLDLVDDLVARGIITRTMADTLKPRVAGADQNVSVLTPRPDDVVIRAD